MQEALKAEHPFGRGFPLRACAAAAVARHLSSSPREVAARRAALLGHWEARSRALEEQEAALHAKLPEEIERVVCSKRILLFRELLSASGYADAEAYRMLAAGFPVVGDIPDSVEFPALERTAPRQVRSLLEDARAAQAAAAASARPSADATLDEALYEETAKEVAAGILRGPISAEALTQKYGLWVPARRFALRQRDKVRPIDDFSIYGQNSTVSAHFKVDLGGVDEVAALCRTLARGLEDGQVRIADEAGFAHDVTVDAGWTGPLSELRGACADLSSAFRQLARVEAHGRFTIISVFNPRKKCQELYEISALAFGEGAAVYAFNRVARGLESILCMFGVLCVNYVDDFPIIEPAGSAEDAVRTFLEVMRLLGWAVKRPESILPAAVFPALGVIFDLAVVAVDRTVVVRNKAERVAEDVAALTGALSRGTLSPAEARRLRGRLQYASAQVFGRCGAMALRALGEFAESRGGPLPLGLRGRMALQWWAAHLARAPPRRIPLCASARPVVVFTDGAVESIVTVGGALFDPRDGAVRFFGLVVPEWVCRERGRVGGEGQVIGQAELASILLAKRLWAARLEGARTIFFIDNNSAREGLIRGYSPIVASARIIAESWLEDSLAASFPWYDRVPGPSNVADGPSRLDFDEIVKMGGVQDEPSTASGWAWAVADEAGLASPF